MTDRPEFEARLEERLSALAAAVDRPFDADGIARSALAAQPQAVKWWRVRATPADRRVVQLLVAAALLAVIGAVLAVASQRPPDASELVRRSQEVHAALPAYTMTTTAFDRAGDGQVDGCGGNRLDETTIHLVRWRYAYDGVHRFSADCIFDGRVDLMFMEQPDPPGSMAGSHTNATLPAALESRPAVASMATPMWLNWIGLGPGLDGIDGRQVTCSSWTLGPVDVVADRAAREVSCGQDRYWIDEASGFLVRVELDGVPISEAVSLEVGPPPVAAFAEPALEGPIRPSLIVGEIPADLNMKADGGATFRSSSLIGRPAAVLMSQGCGTNCLDLDDFVAVIVPHLDRLNAAVITYGQPFPYGRPFHAGRNEALAAGVPIANDDGFNDIAWEMPTRNSSTAIAFFGADGRYIGSTTRLDTRELLAGALQAILRGDPIPEPPARPFTSSVRPLYSLQIGGLGASYWHHQGEWQHADAFTARRPDDEYLGGLFVIRPTDVANPSPQGGVLSAPDDLIGWFANHPNLESQPERAITVGGRVARALDAVARLPAVPGGPRTMDLIRLDDPRPWHYLDAGWRYRFIVVDLDHGDRLLFLFEARDENFDEGLVAFEELLATVQFPGR